MKYSSISVKKIEGVPLGVVGRDGEVCMIARVDKKTTSSLQLLGSLDGINFTLSKRRVSLKTLGGKTEKLKICDRFSLSRTPNGYVMTYVRAGTGKNKNTLAVARSKDLLEWKVFSELPVDDVHHTTIAYDKPRDSFELYRDGLFIKHQSSPTLASWREKPTLLFTSRNGQFDAEKISIIGSVIAKEGILMLYDASVQHEKKTLVQAGAVIFDINNPKRIVWRSDMPIWQAVVEARKSLDLKPLGFVSQGENFIIYWITVNGDLIVARIKSLFKEIEVARHHPKILDRFHGNPIIEPRHGHEWEGEGTFNPGVLEDDEGVVHLLYRAIGRDGISRVGYARSKDGTYFTKRSAFPVFEPREGFGMPDPEKATGPIGYHPAMYTSGGSWGGAEDPRLVRIDDTVYMSYVAFEGWNSVRIAMTSISLADFKAGKWNWKKPHLISPPGKVNKNWLLFPEKIHGKFAVLHSIAPHIAIEYVDDINNLKTFIESPRKDGPQPGRKGKWDSILRGAGPPPLRTEMGWLLLYHALERQDSSRYKLGAMLLDINDPTKILYRSAHPILSPDMDYENDGKPGVVYASGAVIKDGDLYIYYGGADRVVCVATTPLKDFLKYLKSGNAETYKLNKTS